MYRTCQNREGWKVPELSNLPWNGVGSIVLVASLMLNMFSIPMNVHNHEELVRLSPGLSIELAGIDAGLAIDRPFATGDDSFRRLSGSSSTSSSASASTSSSASKSASSKASSSASHGSSASGSASSKSSSGSSSGHSSGCGGSAAGSSAAGSDPHEGHHAHPHDTLIFLFTSFAIGAAVMQISARFPILQQTVLLFTIGFFISLCLNWWKIIDDIGKFGISYSQWMDIDPHLLLFTLLPALLAGDAMTIDTSVAKRVGMQCLWLAGPGVVIGGFGTAAFLKLLIPSWDFTFCLCGGAILCATDPVAVVALLKELGASPIITVQIQGESLLNDGTAIVLYLVSYNMISGHEYDVADICEFLIKKAMMAFALGIFIGYFFFSWIRAAANKLDHSSGMIQITLTLCCAYWSFIFVEGVLELSGVLATVASSLVLANHMWPYVVSEESMNHVWHVFESLGNMIVFFLSGAKTAQIFFLEDKEGNNLFEGIWVLELLAIYIFLLCIRASIIFGSIPVLTRLSADRMPVTWQDATLMCWGGLRGAVGLALAIAVNVHLADHIDGVSGPQIDQKEATRLLFFVSGIAFFTTMINATTAPTLVGKLGITATPQARITLVKMFHSQLILWSKDSQHPPEVTEALQHMIHEVSHHIDHTQVSKTGPASSRASLGEDGGAMGSRRSQVETEAPPMFGQKPCQDNGSLCDELRKHEKLYSEVPNDELHRALMGGPLPPNLLGNVDDMVNLIQNEGVDEGMACVTNQAFLTMVYNNYWTLTHEGFLRPGSPELEVLLTSVRISQISLQTNLTDFDFVAEKMMTSDEFEDQDTEDGEDDEFGGLADADMNAFAKSGCAGRVIATWQFNISVMLAILFSSLQVVAEEIWRDPDNKEINDHIIWLLLDGFFTFFFCFEMVMKLIPMKCAYFASGWNRFDFILVLVGIAGFVMACMAAGDDNDSGNNKALASSRIIRIARVLRTLRFLRIFRLFHARLSADKFISIDLARHMKKVTTLACFVRAHTMAQVQLVKYFGGNGKLDESDESEIARCILQSQVFTYRALILRAETMSKLGQELYEELTCLNQRMHISEGLSEWIMKAHEDGALSATEAHAILHPLNHLIANTVKTLSDVSEGVRSSVAPDHDHHGHGHHEKPVAEVKLALSPEASPLPPDISAGGEPPAAAAAPPPSAPAATSEPAAAKAPPPLAPAGASEPAAALAPPPLAPAGASEAAVCGAPPPLAPAAAASPAPPGAVPASPPPPESSTREPPAGPAPTLASG